MSHCREESNASQVHACHFTIIVPTENLQFTGLGGKKSNLKPFQSHKNVTPPSYIPASSHPEQKLRQM